jgi:hypothetical protein
MALESLRLKSIEATSTVAPTDRIDPIQQHAKESTQFRRTFKQFIKREEE